MAFDTLDDTERRALDVEGSAGAQTALETLELANEAASAAYDQIGALGRIVLREGGDARELLQTLRTATQRLIVAQSELDDTVTGPLAERWTELRDDARIADAERALVAATGDGGLAVLPSRGSPELREVFRLGMERLDTYFTLVLEAAEHAAGEASMLREDALEQRRATLLVTGLLVALTLAGGDIGSHLGAR